VKETAN